MAAVPCVELGFLEKAEDASHLTSPYFPAKVGGRPAWLDPINLPSPERLACQHCGKPCVLLLQLYAPLSDDPAVFHRSLFVFICKDSACHQPGSSKPFRVLRCHLAKDNPFYSAENGCESVNSTNGDSTDGSECVDYIRSTCEFIAPNVTDRYEKGSDVIAVSGELGDSVHNSITQPPVHNSITQPPLCSVCGCTAPKHCGNCKVVHYCSRNHQLVDWKRGHKNVCERIAAGMPLPTARGSGSGSGLLLAEYEIITESESDDGSQKSQERSEKERMEEYLQYVQSDQYRTSHLRQDAHDLMKEAEGSRSKMMADKYFQAFQRRIATEPEQVVRFQPRGMPLLVSGTSLQSVPNCVECGAARVFEFQVMPQLLYYLKLDSVSTNGIDWGTLLIYTCSGNCHHTPGYKEEFIIKQHFA